MSVEESTNVLGAGPPSSWGSDLISASSSGRCHRQVPSVPCAAALYQRHDAVANREAARCPWRCLSLRFFIFRARISHLTSHFALLLTTYHIARLVLDRHHTTSSTLPVPATTGLPHACSCPASDETRTRYGPRPPSRPTRRRVSDWRASSRRKRPSARAMQSTRSCAPNATLERSGL